MEEKNYYSLIGDELLVAIFNEFPKETGMIFKKDVMLALYQASKNHAYAELFENYKFNEDGAFPYSKEVGEGISDMKNINVVYSTSIPNRWQFSKSIELRFNKYISPRLSDEQKQLIKNLSGEIKLFLL